MTFSISIHVDGYYGLVKGVPNLLNLFDKYNIKATFFINMGREANLFQLLKYRKNSQISDKDRKVFSRYSKKEMMKMALFNRALGGKHKRLLREIVKRGHEVNPHCWSHLLWSKNFEGINHLREIQKMKKSYFKIFGKNPKGFAPPTWKFNDKVVDILIKEGFSYLSVDNCLKKITKKQGLKIIPLSFGKNIEELRNEKKTWEEILSIYKKEMGREYVNLYFHADYEGIGGINLFEDVLKLSGRKKTILYKDL